jgi:hypothetical protein
MENTKIGQLIDFVAWKKRKEEEAHRKELEDIRNLKEQVAYYLESMGEIETGPIYPEEDPESWSKRAIDSMLSTLDGYRSWPIDSSDL